MPDDRKILEFPNVHQKLQAPTKQSVFEKQKQDAEAKRLREEAETAAVYKDFVASFDDEDDARDSFGRDRNSGYSGSSGPRRHFDSGPGRRGAFGGRGSGPPKSGPGSLGPLNQKRPYDGFGESGRSRAGRLGFDDERGPKKAFYGSDEEEKDDRGSEPAVPKPTLRLANLPPGTSPAVIKALIPSTLAIDAVRIIPPSAPTTAGERKAMSAIVTLSKETPANDIDSAVNSLQNKYLGYGYYLSLHRHLSSAALSSASTITTSTGNSHPFGAKAVVIEQAPTQQRGFAPPTSYTSTPIRGNQPLLYVPVEAPRDIKELKLIHKTIESMLTHGPEFEALLMSRPEVQREEKWAWLWNSRSTGGVWYRWRLWQILTGSETKRGQGKYLPLFEDSSAWKAPDMPLPYEYTTRLDEFVSDSEYDSSDDDDSGDEGARKTNRGGPPDASALNEDGISYLNPLEKAKLTHLLARLPKSTGQLRRGDVARVTAFAISHAGRGADEVVQAIVSNLERPFAYTSANPSNKTASSDAEDEEDSSSAKLIGLYLISDILSSSSTSGVRHAWRYRQIFESALRNRRVFETLGRLETKMKWGKLRAEKWKRSVGNVLSLWEGWCVFPQDAQDHFTKMFNEPPLTKAEAEAAKEAERLAMEAKAKSKWKSVEDREISAGAAAEDVDGVAMDAEEGGVDGEPMDEDEDLDGVPMVDSDEEEDEYQPPEPPGEVIQQPQNVVEEPKKPPPKFVRARPRAVDMFADSDSDAG